MPVRAPYGAAKLPGQALEVVHGGAALPRHRASLELASGRALRTGRSDAHCHSYCVIIPLRLGCKAEKVAHAAALRLLHAASAPSVAPPQRRPDSHLPKLFVHGSIILHDASMAVCSSWREGAGWQG